MLENLIKHLFPESGCLDDRFQSLSSLDVELLPGLSCEMPALMRGNVVCNLRVGGGACCRHAAQVINLGRSEIEQERCVDLSSSLIFGGKLELCGRTVYISVADAERELEHVDPASFAGWRIHCQDYSREFLQVVADGVEIAVRYVQIFLAELAGEIE